VTNEASDGVMTKERDGAEKEGCDRIDEDEDEEGIESVINT